MAKLITRTFIETNARVKVVDIDTDEILTIVVGVPVSKNTVEKAEKYLSKSNVYGQYKCVSVLEIETEEILRGITESDFLANSVILDKETRKPIDMDKVESMPEPTDSVEE